MASPNDGPNIAPEAPATVLDLYFDIAKNPKLRSEAAREIWDDLSPSDRLTLQQASRAIAGDSLQLSQEYTQSVLLLEYVNRRAESAVFGSDSQS